MSTKRSRLRGLAWASLLGVALGCGMHGGGGGTDSLERMNEDKNTANGLLVQERFQGVVDVLAPWIEREVWDPQVYSMTAKAQWRLEAYDEAVGNYEEALRLDYSDAYTHLELAQLLVDRGKTGRALTEFELAIQYGGRDPLPHYNFGLALFGMGRKDEALAHWEIAYSLDDANATYVEAVGIGLAEVDDEAALGYFERAESLGADHAAFHNNFGLLLQRLGDYTRAESEFENALGREPDNTPYRRNLALLYMVSGRYESAVPLWEELFRRDAGNRAFRIYLARGYLGLRRYDAAIGVLEEWVKRSGEVREGRKTETGGTGEGPREDEAFEVLAMSFRGKGDLGRAGDYIRRALEMRPDSPVYLTNYGVILAESGKIAEARKLWMRVLEIDPENATARQNLSAYEM